MQWKKPQLEGTALKPQAENMSEYCRSDAPEVFADLIKNIDVKYIVVTYNNTYNSKNSASRNKMTLEQIKDMLSATRFWTIWLMVNDQKPSVLCMK